MVLHKSAIMRKKYCLDKSKDMYESYYWDQCRIGMPLFARSRGVSSGESLKESPQRRTPEGIKRSASMENINNQRGSGRKRARLEATPRVSMNHRVKYEDDDDEEEEEEEDSIDEEDEDDDNDDGEEEEDEEESDSDDEATMMMRRRLTRRMKTPKSRTTIMTTGKKRRMRRRIPTTMMGATMMMRRRR